jgi:hypothetical protein
MTLPRSFVLLLASSLLLCSAGRSVAQLRAGLSESHRPLDDGLLDRASAEARLGKRLGHVQEMNQFDRFLDGILKDLKPENLSEEERANLIKLAEKQQKEGKLDLSDPKLVQLMDKMPALKNAELTAAEKQKLLEIAAKQQQGKPVDLKDPNVAHIVEKLNGLRPGDLNPDDLEGLKKIGQQQKEGQPLNLDDPQVGKVVKKLMEGKKGDLGLDEQQFQELWNKFGKAPPSTVKPSPLPPFPGPGPNPQPPMPGKPLTQPGMTRPPGPGPGNEPPLSLRPPPLPPERPSWLSRQFLKFAEKLELDSEAKDAVAKMVKDAGKNSGSVKSSGLGSLSEYLPSDKINETGSFFSKLKLPSVPNVGHLAPQTPNVPTGGGSISVGGADGLFNVLIVLLVVIGAGLVTWKLMSLKHAQADNSGNGWKLGAWPVHPSAVRTRADLVKAFEYLAVLLLGPRAQNQHHLELAEELGRQSTLADPRRSEAARSLAHLYEIARYTPAEESLADDELAEARSELSFLAGAALA